MLHSMMVTDKVQMSEQRKMGSIQRYLVKSVWVGLKTNLLRVRSGGRHDTLQGFEMKHL